MMKDINTEAGYQDQGHQAIFINVDIGEPILEKECNQERWGDYLHSQMMPMEGGIAFLAFTLKDDIAEDGDIEVEGDFVATRCTAGGGLDDGLPLGQAMDQHIKKAAQGGSQDS